MHPIVNSKISESSAKVASVAPGRPADTAGLRAGDLILSIGGHHLRDVIDYQFYLEPGVQEMGVERDGAAMTLLLEVDEYGDPGIQFGTALFDGARRCRNRCLFCFVDQLPRGLRSPLYLKDDDYRLSFLHGNFITLNNINSDDLTRLGEQRLSPLNVSVHATAPVIRAHMMGCSRHAAADGLDAMKTLGKAGIQLHAQIVLCPGVNDGSVLKRTVEELASEFPGVVSVGIVPVALGSEFIGGPGLAGSAAPQRASLKPVRPADCVKVVKSVSAWQERFRQKRGAGFVYAADEFYLKAGLPLPAAADYDGFPQYENGIGIATSFLDELVGLVERLFTEGLPSNRAFLLCGTLAADLVKFAAESLTRSTGCAFQPLVVENRLFGPHATVTGLLGGRDIMAAARAAGLARGDMLVIPASCLESTGKRFLDDLTLAELDEAFECEIRVV